MMTEEITSADLPSAGERIAKRIARAGVASRREAERLIDAGRVTVDGAVVKSPALNVTADAEIAIDGTPIPRPERTRLWRYHKPRERLVSRTDPQGRPTIYADLPPELQRAIPVGRLDFNSEGLLLLTNDGELSRKLELPSEGLVRRYRARAFGHIDQKALDRLAKGITVDGIHYGPIMARLEEARGANAWIALSLTEGKNREVRKVLAALGLKVNRLIRTGYGPYALGDIPTGAAAEVPAASLMRDLGLASAKPKGWAKAKPPSKSRAKQRPGKNARLAARKGAGDKRHADRPESRERDRRPGDHHPGGHRPGDRRPSGHRPGAGRREDQPVANRPDAERPRTDRQGEHRRTAERSGAKRFDAHRPRSGGHDAERHDTRRFDKDRPRPGDRDASRHESHRPDEKRARPDRRDANRPEAKRFEGDRPRASRHDAERRGAERAGPSRSGPGPRGPKRGPKRGPHADRRR